MTTTAKRSAALEDSIIRHWNTISHHQRHERLQECREKGHHFIATWTKGRSICARCCTYRVDPVAS